MAVVVLVFHIKEFGRELKLFSPTYLDMNVFMEILCVRYIVYKKCVLIVVCHQQMVCTYGSNVQCSQMMSILWSYIKLAEVE